MPNLPLMRVVSTITVAFIFSTISHSQSRPPTAPAMVQVDQQWEYIVVSYGKTTFEGPQKTLAYRTLGLSSGSEATDVEANLDIMGRFGWEIVAIIGAIGGDQQIVLKRKYDKARSANEYGMIIRGQEVYFKDLSDIAQRTSRLLDESRRQAEADRNKPRLIDLDSVDEQAERQRKLTGLEKSYAEAFQKLEIASTSTIGVKYKNAYSSDIEVEIRSDLTSKFLKNGNSYRRKEVLSYLKSQVQQYRFKDSALDRYSGVRITAKVSIQFSGEAVDVGRYDTLISIGDRWSDY